MPDSRSDQSMLSSKYICLWWGFSHRQAARGEYGRGAGSAALQIAFRYSAYWTSQSWEFRCRAWRVLVRRCGCSSKSYIRYPFTSLSKDDHGFDQWSKNGCCTSTITLQNVAIWLSQSWGGGWSAWRVWLRLCTSHSCHSGRLRPHVACGW